MKTLLPPDVIKNLDAARPMARVHGSTAVRVVGDLLVRLAGGDAWDCVAIRADDEVVISASSGLDAADIATARAEIRLQRFAGVVLPHVGTSLSSESRRSLFVIFGAFGGNIAVMRVSRSVHGKPYATRDGGAIEMFFRQHAEAIAASIFETGDDREDQLARRGDPMMFVVDATGAVTASIDESPSDQPATLRSLLMPAHGELSPVLRPFVTELLARFAAGARGSDLVLVLPFALVRLTPMRGRATREFLIGVEWLRSRASLEVTAAQYSISKRELQVLSAMLRGAAVTEIAAELSISESTVVFHLKRMLKKTASRNRTELAARMLAWETRTG